MLRKRFLLCSNLYCFAMHFSCFYTLSVRESSDSLCKMQSDNSNPEMKSKIFYVSINQEKSLQEKENLRSLIE